MPRHMKMRWAPGLAGTLERGINGGAMRARRPRCRKPGKAHARSVCGLLVDHLKQQLPCVRLIASLNCIGEMI